MVEGLVSGVVSVPTERLVDGVVGVTNDSVDVRVTSDGRSRVTTDGNRRVTG